MLVDDHHSAHHGSNETMANPEFACELPESETNVTSVIQVYTYFKINAAAIITAYYLRMDLLLGLNPPKDWFWVPTSGVTS